MTIVMNKLSLRRRSSDIVRNAACFLMVAFLLFSARADFLELDAPVKRWVDAIPLGNGQAGALIWGEGDELRITLDRADYWHQHRNPMLDDPRFKWSNLPNYTNDYEELKRVFVVREDPTKLPGIRFTAKLVEGVRLLKFTLDIRDSSSRIVVSTPAGERTLRAWFDDSSPYLSLAIPEDVTLNDIQFVKNMAFEKLGGYPDPEIDISGKGAFYRRGNRKGASGPWIKPFVAGVKFTGPAGRPASDYWPRFWKDSEVRVPDGQLQRFYDFAMYCYGAASRTPHAPIALQAVWTADNGKLPPWHGDYHMDMNIQETYWAAPVAGKFDAIDAYANHMVAILPALQAYGRDFFDMKNGGAAIPGHMAYDGTFIAGGPMWALPPVHGLWAFQQVFDAWAYRPTQERLEKIWPLAVALAEGIEQVLPKGPDGIRRYAISASPEFGENTPKSVTLKGNTTYDRSITCGFFKEVARLAAAKGDDARERHWLEMAGSLGGPHLDEKGRYLLDATTPLTFSHRHPSQLHDIFPYFDVDKGADAKATYAAYRALGLECWAGHTIVECACKAAALGDGDEALFCLRSFTDHFTSRNGFHVNGYLPAARTGHAARCDVFTLEANLAMARGVQEMLLRGEWGRISLFPAIPKAWKGKAISFRDLVVRGGHRVSASMDADGTVKARITGFSDCTVQLVMPDGRKKTVALRKGETTELE
ncbi:MAG: hypothetical protein IKJ37_01510 [Kiritimatiellae bacterium]|nr:hypothetical protein [Kiritimatiellia bacterium]